MGPPYCLPSQGRKAGTSTITFQEGMCPLQVAVLKGNELLIHEVHKIEGTGQAYDTGKVGVVIGSSCLYLEVFL